MKQILPIIFPIKNVDWKAYCTHLRHEEENIKLLNDLHNENAWYIFD